jgi:hypothetical protein
MALNSLAKESLDIVDEDDVGRSLVVLPASL